MRAGRQILGKAADGKTVRIIVAIHRPNAIRVEVQVVPVGSVVGRRGPVVSVCTLIVHNTRVPSTVPGCRLLVIALLFAAADRIFHPNDEQMTIPYFRVVHN